MIATALNDHFFSVFIEGQTQVKQISLTSVTCKVLDRLVRDAIVEYWLKNHFISQDKHGFVRRKVWVTNLLETVEFVTKNMKDKVPIDIIFLDFAKAFDKVPYHRLLHKLEKMGLSGRIVNLIKALLSNRKQRVLGKYFFWMGACQIWYSPRQRSGTNTVCCICEWSAFNVIKLLQTLRWPL